MAKRRFGPYTFNTSSEGKVLFPGVAKTKGDLIAYYDRIADVMLPHLRDRPLTMQRFPNGIGETGFYHKNIPDHFPDWIDRVRVTRKAGGHVTHVICRNKATLVYLADQACVTPHIWLSRKDRLDQPDRLVIDLDPSSQDFQAVRRAASLCVDRLEELGLVPFLQLTGSRGIHVVAPIRRGPSFEEVRKLARCLARQLVAEYPGQLTVEQRKADRGERVYLDTGRIAYAQTMVAPYAVRARPRAPVATPILRDELEDPELNACRYDVTNIFRRLSRRGDPWKHMARSARSISGLLKRISSADT